MRKALFILMCLVAMSATGTSLEAQEVTIVLNPGWTWISYPGTEPVDLVSALGSFTPKVGDIVASEWSASEYIGGEWLGDVDTFYPGYGYMYYSTRMAPVTLTFNAQQPVPQVLVTTSEPMLITAISAMGGGEVTVNDGTYIIVKGLCWATHENPTTNEDFFLEVGSGVGSFTVSMTDLNINTTYYVRAYAVTSNGTVYGEQKTFTTRDGIPTVTTAEVTGITGEIAICGGTITDNGGLNITTRGVCWSTSPNPTLSDSHTTNGMGEGGFVSALTSLTLNTTYYVRAYATNSYTTVYGNQRSFTAEPIPNYIIAVSSNPTEGGTANVEFDRYVRINNLNELTEGSRVVFAARFDDNASDYYAMRNTSSGKPIGVLFTSTSSDGFEILPSSITNEEDDFYWTVGVTANGYTFTNAAGQMVGWTSSTNFAPEENTEWSIMNETAGESAMVPNYAGFTITNTNTARGFALNNSHNYGAYAVSNNNSANYNFFLDIFMLDQRSCTVRAMANEGYTFTNWTENDEVVSTDATYTFIVSANRTLIANFTYNGGSDDHAYVDLGLPSGLLWATCNVGADAPEDYGQYFAWGETQPKNAYNWSTYQYCNGGDGWNTLTKYCNKSSFGYNGFTDNLTTLLPEDDAATANWGDGWRMPTRAEFQELYNNTTVTWTTQNGVNGRLFTASNGNTLFLPATGCRYYGTLFHAGSYGYYWSSSLHTDHPDYAWYFYSDSGNYGVFVEYRNYGQTIRPVRAGLQN